jgi:hypothetical protein
MWNICLYLQFRLEKRTRVQGQEENVLKVEMRALSPFEKLLEVWVEIQVGISYLNS